MHGKIAFSIVAAALTAGFAPAESFNLTSFADPLHPKSTLARAINDEGQIVGDYESFTAAFTTGFLYQNGAFTTINFPEATYTVATGINNAGEIVGYYADGFSRVHGFVYDRQSFSSIDTPNSVGTWISGINNKGQLVGYYSDALSAFHGLLYDHGTLTTLDDPNAGVLGSTRLLGINDAGRAIGEAASPISGTRGFIYDQGQFSAFTDSLSGIDPIPAAINNVGQIAGTGVLNNLSYAFVNTDGNFTYFRDPAYTETTVCGQLCVTVSIPIQLSGINDAGVILGFHSYIDVTSPVVASLIGTPMAASPVPESASAGLFAVGIAAIGLLYAARRLARKN